MLISYHGEVTRLQCAFVDTPEVEEVVEFIGDQRGYPQAFLYLNMLMKKNWKERILICLTGILCLKMLPG